MLEDKTRKLQIMLAEKSKYQVRKTNRNVIAQYVTSKEAQDKIEIGINSKILLKYGWPKEAEKSLKSMVFFVNPGEESG